MELNEALAQITEIRAHLARTEVFRGFRSISVAATAGVALLAGGLQTAVFPSAANDINLYLTIWIGAAAAGVLVAGIAILLRARRISGRLERETTQLALEQFGPCLLAGSIVTASLYLAARDSCWLLPGLWCILFSLGVFACYRSIDVSLFAAAAYYLLAGMFILFVVPPTESLAPWVMMSAFGGGQALTAVLLYWRLERIT